jgi:hypothetical protein
MEDNCWAEQNSHRVVASIKKKTNRRGHVRGPPIPVLILHCVLQFRRDERAISASQVEPSVLSRTASRKSHPTHDNVAGNNSRNVTSKADLTPTLAAGTRIDRGLWWGSRHRTYLRPAKPKDTNMSNVKTKFPASFDYVPWQKEAQVFSSGYTFRCFTALKSIWRSSVPVKASA